MVVDGNVMPNIALNDQTAINKGYPFLLTANRDEKIREYKRRAACGGWKKQWGSCDEYPFASSMEGGPAPRRWVCRALSKEVREGLSPGSIMRIE